jgi:hypothetical protein
MTRTTTATSIQACDLRGSSPESALTISTIEGTSSTRRWSDPPVWLQPGDVVELGIEGLGSQRQRVVGPR